MFHDVGGVQLEMIVTAELPFPRAYVFRGGGPGVARPPRLLAVAVLPGGEPPLRGQCLAYVIRHPSAGTLLVDTGFHPDARADLRKDFGLAMGLFFRGLKPAETPYDEQLRELGVEPGEVERAIMTHLHVDHTSGMRLLPRARFICTRPEWKAARGRGVSARGFVSHHLPPESRTELIDFEADGEPYGPFTRTVDLLGDGTVRLVSTPGHTPGHMSVLVCVEGGGQVLIVGDAAYTLRSIREQVLPLLTADDDAYRSSLAELKAFSEEEPDAVLVPTHDPDAWRQLSGAGSDARVRAGA